MLFAVHIILIILSFIIMWPVPYAELTVVYGGLLILIISRVLQLFNCDKIARILVIFDLFYVILGLLTLLVIKLLS